jgi:hypothetical protein
MKRNKLLLKTPLLIPYRLKRIIDICCVGGHSILFIKHSQFNSNDFDVILLMVARYNLFDFKIINICPCGNYSSLIDECVCLPHELDNHLNKIQLESKNYDLIFELDNVMNDEKTETCTYLPNRQTVPVLSLPDNFFIKDFKRKGYVKGDIAKVISTIASIDRYSKVKDAIVIEAISYTNNPLISQ